MFLVICIGALVVAYVACVLVSVYTTVDAFALARLVESLLVRARVATHISHSSDIGRISHTSCTDQAWPARTLNLMMNGFVTRFLRFGNLTKQMVEAILVQSLPVN